MVKTTGLKCLGHHTQTFHAASYFFLLFLLFLILKRRKIKKRATTVWEENQRMWCEKTKKTRKLKNDEKKVMWNQLSQFVDRIGSLRKHTSRPPHDKETRLFFTVFRLNCFLKKLIDWCKKTCLLKKIVYCLKVCLHLWWSQKQWKHFGDQWGVWITHHNNTCEWTWDRIENI